MAMSSIPTPASSSAWRPPSSTAGVRVKLSRYDTNGCSWQSVPGVGEHPAIPGHAEALGRLGRAHDHGGGHVDVVVRVHVLAVRQRRPCGSAVSSCGSPRPTSTRGSQAYGLPAATSLKRAHSSLTWTRCSSGLRRRRRGPPSRTSGTAAPAGRRRARPRPGGSCRGRRRAWSAAGPRVPSASRGSRRSCGPACGCATPRHRRARRCRAGRRPARERWVDERCGVLPPAVV